jgi:DNA-binding NarL/FixJ family response regulator
VLLDIGLPDVSGLTVAERLARGPEPPTVMLTSARDPADFGDLVARCGARGFVPKAALSGEALSAVLFQP